MLLHCTMSSPAKLVPLKGKWKCSLCDKEFNKQLSDQNFAGHCGSKRHKKAAKGLSSFLEQKKRFTKWAGLGQAGEAKKRKREEKKRAEQEELDAIEAVLRADRENIKKDSKDKREKVSSMKFPYGETMRGQKAIENAERDARGYLTLEARQELRDKEDSTFWQLILGDFVGDFSDAVNLSMVSKSFKKDADEFIDRHEDEFEQWKASVIPPPLLQLEDFEEEPKTLEELKDLIARSVFKNDFQFWKEEKGGSDMWCCAFCIEHIDIVKQTSLYRGIRGILLTEGAVVRKKRIWSHFKGMHQQVREKWMLQCSIN